MSRILAFYRTTIGKKFIMAATGLVLLLFALGHLVGNLQVYSGAERLNAYAALLHHSQGLLWTVRIVLLAVVLLHISTAVLLWLHNANARPLPYAVRRDLALTYASRTMYFTGPLLALFIVYHLLHLTVRVTPDFAFSETDVYANVIGGFRIWWLTGIYVVAQIALGLHIFHGAWSLSQTVGLSHPTIDPLRRLATWVLAIGILLGNISIPVSILSGVVPPSASPRVAAGPDGR